jgi:hypothetical protein
VGRELIDLKGLRKDFEPQRAGTFGGSAVAGYENDGQVGPVAPGLGRQGEPVHLPWHHEVRDEDIRAILFQYGQRKLGSGTERTLKPSARCRICFGLIKPPLLREHGGTLDMRRTGVSRLAPMGFDSIMADKLLAHKPAKLKGVASVYHRHDFAAERRAALDAWAAHVTCAAPGGNVVPLQRAAGSVWGREI